MTSPENERPSSDYRVAFYSQYHRALNLRPERPDERKLRQQVRHNEWRWNGWLPKDKRVPCLDLGCGLGEFLYYLRQQGFEDVRGVDLNAEELEVARALGIASVEQGDALSFLQSAAPGSYGLISAFNFFEHLTKSEILAILPAIHRALRPGGVVLAVTPNGLSPFSGTTRYWDFSHETGFTPASWRQLARLAGFSEAIFEEYGPIPYSLLGSVRTAAWQAVRLGLMAISFVEVGGPRDPSKTYTADMKIILRR